MELSRKQLIKIIDEQSKRLPKDSFISYDSNDNDEQLLICRCINEMSIFFESLKRSYSRNTDEMSFQERICKQEIISSILYNGEAFKFDYQIWHALNKINNVLEQIFIKTSSDFFKQYPNFIFDKDILLDIATSYLTKKSTFNVKILLFPKHTYCDFEESYEFENFEEFDNFIQTIKEHMLNSVSSSIGFHYTIPVRTIVNSYSIFDGERRLYQTCLFDVKYDISKKKMVVVKL